MPSDHKRGHESKNPELNVASIGNYIIIRTLGEGNFAKVKLAKHKITGAEVAIKFIDKTKMDPKKINKMYREVRILKMLHHPNIIKLYEVIETSHTVFLVMENVSNGELYDYLVVHGKMKEKEARIKFRQILSAVSYCHKKRVIHRDLKAENLLLDANNNIKIADFGFSNNYDPYDKLDTFCGSPPYAAPELFQGRRYTGPEVDIWSLGVILYVMTTGCLPFNGKNLHEVRESVCRGKYRIPFYITDSCEKLIKKFLVRDPAKRASLDLFRDDPWINEGFTDSPIDVNTDEIIEQDDEIIDKIVEKYKLDRETLINHLNNKVYDEFSAIYYLMYYDKKSKKEKGLLKNSSNDEPSSFKNNSNDESSSFSSKKNTSNHSIVQTPINPGPLKLISPVSIKQNPVRTRRFTIDSTYHPLPFNKDVIINKFSQNQKENTNNDTDNNNNNNTIIKEYSNEEITNDSVIKKPTETSNMPPKHLVPIPPDKPPSGAPMGRRLRHNTISEAVPPVSIRQFAANNDNNNNNNNNNILQENSEEEENTNNNENNETSIVEENYDPTKPRSVRFTMNTNTTSSKAPDEIIRSVIMACKALNIGHKMIGRYLVECSVDEFEGVVLEEKATFEVEVCKLPRLDNMYGLKFKRLSGPTNEYKEICEKLIKYIKL
ncbi:Pkinase-domain-containing protein [Anaeromyces robustus]|uniref:non-specific serine/threonine protein kinase n=1 Tax=Anaeromyces robustus TaxID=1754192 RepID=A0A1Y1WQU6_9FUNG|nr:Pkinase-domain-containing protein [Anaeromyces robustus]|eukprot:ORX75494.1 Pkinase-domain-containing protein [Anaeromyces robustus]